MTSGDAAWTDYLLETTVMLKQTTGNAGLVFRVNRPGPKSDQMRGYYVGFNTNTLYLGKMNNSWHQMATLELAKRENKIQLEAWNLLRVAVQGPHIRVWFNPLHDDTNPVFDLRDENQPILSGNVGLLTHDTTACFDDVVVLPLSVLEP